MPKLLVLAALLGMLAVAAFAGDAAIILDSRSGSLSAPQLDETEAADLIAHIMGLSPLHPKLSRANFPTTNLFKRPNSNLIVLIDGVGSNAITHLSSSMSFLNADASHSALLQQELSTSRSSLASTVTLMTGEAPNAHGIHGRTWLSPEQTEEQIAFASINSRVPSIADLLLTTLEKSSFVSISSDRQLAAALGPHPQTFSRAHVIFWDETTSSFVSRAGERFLSHDDVVAFVQNALPLLTKARVSLTGTKVEFSSTKAHAVFDLSSARDFALFAELAAIVNTVPSLASVPQDDLSCDLFAVGVASIRLLEEQYGPSSPQVLAGLYLVDAALSKLSAQLDEIYSHKTTRQTLLLGSSVHSANRAARSVLSTSAVQSSSNTTYTEDQVADYQISIWASVFLVIALFVPIYSFMNMDTSSDSILYRIAGPRMS